MRTIGIVYGGKSGEHDVSRCSAASVYAAIDTTKYRVVAIGIDRDGKWYPQKEVSVVHDRSFGSVLELHTEGNWLVNHFARNHQLSLYNTENGETVTVDVIFPVVHGTYCEDGTLQGLLELASVPYVGADVLGSAVGMDKDVAKRLLQEQGIPVVPWITLYRHVWEQKQEDVIDKIKQQIGFPFFVKPANAGSSVGISKVKQESDMVALINTTFKYDVKILIEQAIECSEIECAVLGNWEPEASGLGQIIPRHEFYSYEAKYIDNAGAELKIPAPLDGELSAKIRTSAVEAYTTLCLKGMARVDFFVTKDAGQFYLNEVNTLPGFTSISMYPKLWEYAGISYASLIDRLIELALQAHAVKKNMVIEGL